MISKALKLFRFIKKKKRLATQSDLRCPKCNDYLHYHVLSGDGSLGYLKLYKTNPEYTNTLNAHYHCIRRNCLGYLCRNSAGYIETAVENYQKVIQSVQIEESRQVAEAIKGWLE